MTGTQPPRPAALDTGQAGAGHRRAAAQPAGLLEDLSGEQRRRPSLCTGWTVRHGWNVNRIKMLKRQMYGRARLGLLRKRVLLA
jgi:Mycothiol maleylpyruvate isomerase N-terminal domain